MDLFLGISTAAAAASTPNGNVGAGLWTYLSTLVSVTGAVLSVGTYILNVRTLDQRADRAELRGIYRRIHKRLSDITKVTSVGPGALERAPNGAWAWSNTAMRQLEQNGDAALVEPELFAKLIAAEDAYLRACSTLMNDARDLLPVLKACFDEATNPEAQRYDFESADAVINPDYVLLHGDTYLDNIEIKGEGTSIALYLPMIMGGGQFCGAGPTNMLPGHTVYTIIAKIKAARASADGRSAAALFNALEEISRLRSEVHKRVAEPHSLFRGFFRTLGAKLGW